MSRYVFTAIFEPEEGMYNVYFPDLPSCYTCGETLAEALRMAEDVLGGYLSRAEERGEDIPQPREIAQTEIPENAKTSMILADTEEYRRVHSSRAVKKTLTIPSWLNEAAEQQCVNFSQVLQEALKQRLGMV